MADPLAQMARTPMLPPTFQPPAPVVVEEIRESGLYHWPRTRSLSLARTLSQHQRRQTQILLLPSTKPTHSASKNSTRPSTTTGPPLINTATVFSISLVLLPHTPIVASHASRSYRPFSRKEVRACACIICGLLRFGSVVAVPHFVPPIIANPANPNARDAEEQTPLHWAARSGAVPVLKLLLDHDGGTYAMHSSHPPTHSPAHPLTIIIASPPPPPPLSADPTLQDKLGYNCLHHAAMGGNDMMCFWLLDK